MGIEQFWFKIKYICETIAFIFETWFFIKIRGECIEVPIYVEKPLYDFEICLLNHIYREKIVFFNRS